MAVYNKLVRDLIPEMIERSGKSYSTKKLDQEEYMKQLIKKCFEEFNEYIHTTNKEDAIEELADILEVIYALADVHGASPKHLEEIRNRKFEQRGGFKEKIFLIEVEEN